MKKVFALLLLLAVFGGYQLLFWEENPADSSSRSANISYGENSTFSEEKSCLLYRQGAENSLKEGETISSLFYSEKTNSCLAEKRSQYNGYLMLTLFDLTSGDELAKFSSDAEKGYLPYKEYRALLEAYQNPFSFSSEQ